jgi:hypothetical protein
LLITNGLTVFAAARFVLREQNELAVLHSKTPTSSEKYGCGATHRSDCTIDLPVIRVCFECLNHFVVRHTMTVHTNTVMAMIHEKALMVGCLSWRFDLTARRTSAETIASAA